MSFVEIKAASVRSGDELILARSGHRWPGGALWVEKVSSETVTSVTTSGGTTSIETAARTRSSSADTLVVVERE